MHGQAVPVDVRSSDHAAFRRALLDVYLPRYGPGWEAFLDSGPVYARIDAARMFTSPGRRSLSGAPGRAG